MIEKILFNCELIRNNSLKKDKIFILIKEFFFSKMHYFYLWYYYWYYLYKFKSNDFNLIPEKYVSILKKYLEILEWKNINNSLKYFNDILNLPDLENKYRDFLFWWFSFVLWNYMHNRENFDETTYIWVNLIKIAFSLDNYDYKRKISSINKVDEKIICIWWSWKKNSKYKLLNISSMSAVITASFWIMYWKNIIVSKVWSKSTSSVTWSEDIFSYLWINLNHSIKEMYDISKKTKLWIYSIWNIVPKLNHVYDNRLYNVNVFAWLVWWPAIVNPIKWDLIYYWLTTWNWEITSNILYKIYKKNILVINWENKKWKKIIDQFSLDGYTNISWVINNKSVNFKLTPENFWINYSNYKWVLTSDNIKSNSEYFLDLLSWKSSENLKNIIAMETTMQLYWIWIIDDFVKWFNLTKNVINSWIWIKILENLILSTWWNIEILNKYLKS